MARGVLTLGISIPSLCKFTCTEHCLRMDMIPLPAQARSKDIKAKALRRKGTVPCIVYGNVENLQLQCAEAELVRVYTKAGESTLVSLEAPGKKIPALIHAIHFDPLTDRITHVDFYAVDMKKEIEAHVPIRLEGVSLAVKELGAVLVTTLDHVTVRCLPGNLPHMLTADISALKEFGDTLMLSAVKIPEGVKVQQAPETVIATVQEPRREEVIVAAPAEGEVPAEGAVTEGAEGAAGTAAPAAEAAPEEGPPSAKATEGKKGKKDKKDKKEKKEKKEKK